MTRLTASFMALVLAAAVACRGGQPSEQPAVQQTADQTSSQSEQQRLEQMTRRFAPVDISADISGLPDNERQALAKLVEAAKYFDALFLRQVWAGNETMLMDLVRDRSELGQARLHYFLINKGPWSRLDGG
jgi:hypothetical protein